MTYVHRYTLHNNTFNYDVVHKIHRLKKVCQITVNKKRMQ